MIRATFKKNNPKGDNDRKLDRKTFFLALTKVFLILLVITGIMTSCSKEEGYGGKASIKGMIVTKAFNNDTSILLKTYPAADQEVYIQFGNSDTYGERIRTLPDGVFIFSHLTPGNYTIYYFSDAYGPDIPDEEAILVDVTISSSDREVDIGVLERIELLDFDDGNSSISGKIIKIHHDSGTTGPAVDEPVYLVYGNKKGYDERIRTAHDGTYRFPNLIKGEYTIYTYSEASSGPDVPVIHPPVVISGENEHVLIDDMFIMDF